MFSPVTHPFLLLRLPSGFGDINEALAYIAKCKQLKPEDLTIPSQRRYAFYFKNMLDGVRPSQPPLLLKRIIMSEAPKVSSWMITGQCVPCVSIRCGSSIAHKSHSSFPNSHIYWMLPPSLRKGRPETTSNRGSNQMVKAAERTTKKRS